MQISKRLKMKSKYVFAYFRFGLALVFIFCKLTGHINWSWVWVLSPIWIIEVIWLILMILLGIDTYFKHELARKRLQDREDMMDRVNRKVADEIYNGEN